MKHIVVQLMVVVLLMLGAVACGSAATPPPTQSAAKPIGQAEPSSVGPASAGLDLSNVDVCQLIPAAEVEAIVGPLRKDSTKPTRSLDREQGCHYVDDKHGQFFEVELYPLDQWNLAKRTLRNAQPVAAVGDGAYLGTYSDCVWLKVLVKDRVVVSVRVGDEKLDTALALYPVVVKHLP